MTLSDADATVIAAVFVAGGTWLAGRGRKANRSAMEKLVAKVTEEASEQYRDEITRNEQQHRAEIERLSKQYKESIAWYQKQLKSGGSNDA